MERGHEKERKGVLSMVEKSLNTLQDNLKKKASALEKFGGLVKQQALLLEDPDATPEQLDACMDEQDKLTAQINALSEEFEQVCETLKHSLPDERSEHQKQIDSIMDANAKIDEMTRRIVEGLAVNKSKIQDYLSKERRNLGAGRKSSQAAMNYYKNMSGSNVVPSYFMDHKQ